MSLRVDIYFFFLFWFACGKSPLGDKQVGRDQSSISQFVTNYLVIEST